MYFFLCTDYRMTLDYLIDEHVQREIALGPALSKPRSLNLHSANKKLVLDVKSYKNLKIFNLGKDFQVQPPIYS
uniref:Uncharacterized protein n=1 Tax=Salix viminalis TaxID=40686 RepID=A0A6N2LLQ5_SALVM